MWRCFHPWVQLHLCCSCCHPFCLLFCIYFLSFFYSFFSNPIKISQFLNKSLFFSICLLFKERKENAQLKYIFIFNFYWKLLHIKICELFQLFLLKIPIQNKKKKFPFFFFNFIFKTLNFYIHLNSYFICCNIWKENGENFVNFFLLLFLLSLD